MDTEGSIQISCVSLVKPAKPTVRHVLYMSGVDQLLRAAPPSRSILFYDTDTDATAAAAILRQGLASALVAFYPLAGQLVLADDGRLAIDCNDTGVEFIEASCDIQFTDLQLHGHFPIGPLFRRLVPMDSHSTSDHVGEPIASVQVTSFVGGLTLGIAISHSVADGYSFWKFIKAVAEACKGEPLSMFPLHARSLLKADNFLLTKFPSLPARQFLPEDQPKESSSYKDTFTERTGLSPKQRILSIPPEQLQHKSIQISKDMLQTLKMACLNTHKQPPSSFEALSAYLWKRLTMAQELPDETRVDFRVPLDVRRRIIPPLTPSFFGNAVVAVTVTTATAKELKAECLGETAARIRREVQNGDDAYIKKAIVDREKLDLRNIVNEGEEVIFSIRNGSHFPVYQASSFGWGEAQVVRPPWGDRETQMTWYSSKEPGGIDVITSLSASTSALFFSPRLYPNDPLLPHHHALFEPASTA